MTKNTTGKTHSLPPRNRYSSRREWEEACWKIIAKSEKLLNSLATLYERRNIVMRAAVMDLVNSGAGPRKISRELQISRQTISSIKKAVTKETSYKSYWERSKTERKKKVWSPDIYRKKKEPYRRYRRTKYGKVYLHY